MEKVRSAICTDSELPLIWGCPTHCVAPMAMFVCGMARTCSDHYGTIGRYEPSRCLWKHAG